MMIDQFEDIRPYNDSELQDAFQELMHDDDFLKTIQALVPEKMIAQFPQIIKSIKTQQDFQELIMYPLLEIILMRNGTILTGTGLHEEVTHPALFVSNHRDIVTDPAFLDYFLLKNHWQTVEIAIGDNLLIRPWIRSLVRINKSFIVQRSYTPKEAAQLFQKLSAYIRYAITEKKEGVWIAQREGRAKDSDDRTQESILKMFALSGSGSFIENLLPLNIRPTTISYEFDPCDYLKAIEFQNRRDNPDFVKSKADDLISMRTGIFGKKGHVHYHFAPIITPQLEAIAQETKNRKEQVQRVKELIDQTIFANYVLYPINYVAYEALTGDQQFTTKVKPNERIEAENYIEQQLAKINMENADWVYLRNIFLVMYANPVINKFNLKK